MRKNDTCIHFSVNLFRRVLRLRPHADQRAVPNQRYQSMFLRHLPRWRGSPGPREKLWVENPHLSNQWNEIETNRPPRNKLLYRSYFLLLFCFSHVFCWLQPNMVSTKPWEKSGKQTLQKTHPPWVWDCQVWGKQWCVFFRLAGGMIYTHSIGSHGNGIFNLHEWLISMVNV